MSRKIIYGIASLVNLGIAICYLVSLLNCSPGTGARANAIHATQYILIGLFMTCSIIFATKLFKKR